MEIELTVLGGALLLVLVCCIGAWTSTKKRLHVVGDWMTLSLLTHDDEISDEGRVERGLAKIMSRNACFPMSTASSTVGSVAPLPPRNPSPSLPPGPPSSSAVGDQIVMDDVEREVDVGAGTDGAAAGSSAAALHGCNHGDTSEEAASHLSTDVRSNKCARRHSPPPSCAPHPPSGDLDPTTYVTPSTGHSSSGDHASDRTEARSPAAAAEGGVVPLVVPEAASLRSHAAAAASAAAHPAPAVHPAPAAHPDDGAHDPSWSEDSDGSSSVASVERGSAVSSAGDARGDAAAAERALLPTGAPVRSEPSLAPERRARTSQPRVSFGLVKREGQMWDAIAMPPPRGRPPWRHEGSRGRDV
jgi:hypothetical protein